MTTLPASGPALAIVAGAGALPAVIAETAIAQGRRVFVLALKGFAELERFRAFPHAVFPLGSPGAMFARLRREGIEEVILAGAVRRPSLSDLRADWRAVRVLTKAALGGLGDDGLLGLVRETIEAEGFRVVGVSDVLDDTGPLMAQPGYIGGHRADAQALADIERGLQAAAALGAADIGQAVIVQQGIVLAVEAVEGTDGLLARAGALTRSGPGGVLVKIAKPDQDHRLDQPAAGPETVKGAAVAGLRGIALGAGDPQRAVLIMNRSETIAAADAAGLFLLGLDPAKRVADQV